MGLTVTTTAATLEWIEGRGSYALSFPLYSAIEKVEVNGREKEILKYLFLEIPNPEKSYTLVYEGEAAYFLVAALKAMTARYAVLSYKEKWIVIKIGLLGDRPEIVAECSNEDVAEDIRYSLQYVEDQRHDRDV